MPQCQRSPRNTILDGAEGSQVSRTVWRCPGAPHSPGCPGGETYELIVSQPCLAVIGDAIAGCAAEFGARVPTKQLNMWLGERPMYVESEGVGNIYLLRDSDGLQLRRQVAHEAFHYLFTPRKAFPWTHEMLADMWVGLYLRGGDLDSYAQRDTEQLVAEANLISLAEMQQCKTPPYPAGYFGRALLTGTELQKLVGWESLKQLAVCLTPDGAPDVDAWVASLPEFVVGDVRELLSN